MAAFGRALLVQGEKVLLHSNNKRGVSRGQHGQKAQSHPGEKYSGTRKATLHFPRKIIP